MDQRVQDAHPVLQGLYRQTRCALRCHYFQLYLLLFAVTVLGQSFLSVYAALDLLVGQLIVYYPVGLFDLLVGGEPFADQKQVVAQQSQQGQQEYSANDCDYQIQHEIPHERILLQSNGGREIYADGEADEDEEVEGGEVGQEVPSLWGWYL